MKDRCASGTGSRRRRPGFTASRSGALRWRRVLIILAALGLLATYGGPAGSTPPTPHGFIVANVGQFNSRTAYQVVGQGYLAWINPDGLWLSLAVPGSRRFYHLHLALPGPATLQPEAPLTTTVSYLRGAQGAARLSAAPVWGRLRLRLKGGNEILVRPASFHLNLEAAAPIELTLTGLDPIMPPGRTLLPAWLGGRALPLDAAATIRWRDRESHQLRRLPARPERPGSPRVVGAAAPAHGAVPVLRYSTFLGGLLWDEANAVALDSAGNAYITGHSTSASLPKAPGLSPEHGVDVFVARLAADGTNLDYLVHLNSAAEDDEDYARAIAVDADGHAFVGGRTDSADFPVTPDAYDPTYNGTTDAFVLKLLPDGSGLAYGTYLGGGALDGFDEITGLAIRPSGRVVVTGGTWSPDLLPPGLPGHDGHSGLRDAFVAELSADGRQLLAGAYLGGSDQDMGTALALTPAGAGLVTGWTRSELDFPVTEGALASTHQGGVFDAFLARLSPDLALLEYATYLGGNGVDRAWTIAVDGQGRPIIGGLTLSTNLAVSPGALDAGCGSDGACDDDGGGPKEDGFLLRLSRSGDRLDYASYLGGEASDQVAGLAVDNLGRIVATGWTASGQFPVTADGLAPSLVGASDAFVVRLSPDGSVLEYGTFLGSSDADYGQGLSLHEAGVVLVGRTRWSGAGESDFPISAGVADETHNGDYDGFVSRFEWAPLWQRFVPLLQR